MDFRRAISLNVNMLRKERKLTLAQLGDVLGIKSQSVHTLEKGKTAPNFDTLMALADYFDCSVDFLVGRTSNRESHKLV